MRKCLKCGFEGESSFCPNCGAAMAKDETIPPDDYMAAETAKNESRADSVSGSSMGYSYASEPKDTFDNYRNGSSKASEKDSEFDDNKYNSNDESYQSKSSTSYSYAKNDNFDTSGSSYERKPDYTINLEKEPQTHMGQGCLTAVLLVFFPPIGLILMWIQKTYAKKTRVVVTVIVAIWALLLSFFIYGCYLTAQEEYYTNPETDVLIEEESDPTAPETTLGEDNALDKAYSYLNVMGFSREGLISQLEFEGFTTEEATYAADNCGADWNEQAAIKAELYLSTQSFSREGLIDQLMFDGFTRSQAEFGVTSVGY